MLLVQEKGRDESQKAVAHTVGSPHLVPVSPQVPTVMPPVADGSAYGNDALPPVELGVGETREEFSIKARAKLSRRYILQGNECLTWVCSVFDGYTIDLSAKVSVQRGSSKVMLGGRPLNLVGVDSSRVVSEKERGGSPSGYLDLGGEHKGCVDLDGPDGSAVLTIEMDNSFSYFTGKSLRLRITKTLQGQDLKPQARSFASLAPVAAKLVAATVPATTASSKASPTESASPTRGESPSVLGGSCASAAGQGFASIEEEDPLVRLRSHVVEALRLCPSDAPALREHLRAAQVHVSEYSARSQHQHEDIF